MATTDETFNQAVPDWDRVKADQKEDALRDQVLGQLERERRARSMRRLEAQLEYLRIHGRPAW